MTQNRELVENKVKENRGITFTELKKETGLENGVLQHHIRKSDKIEKKNKAILTKEVCKGCKYSEICQNRCVASILRDKKKYKILKLKEKGKKQIKIAKNLELDKSTINYHIKALKKDNLLDKDGNIQKVVKKQI